MSIKTVDVRLRSPFTAIVSGPTGSGKTSLLLDLIRQAASVATPPPVAIYYHYGEWQDVFGETSEATFRRGPPDVEADVPNDGQNRWLIIDDLMEEALGKGTSNALYTKYSHHRNISVFSSRRTSFTRTSAPSRSTRTTFSLVRTYATQAPSPFSPSRPFPDKRIT